MTQAFKTTRFISLAAILLLCPALSQAGKPFADVVQIAPDTYSISRTDHAGIFGNAGKMKTKVMQEAQAFAESQGKVAVFRHLQETPMVVGRSFASIQYEFWVVDKNDPAAHREDIHKEPDQVTVEHVQVVTAQKDGAAKKDMYEELLKLDDLHKRGILTDAEFEQQKQKLLSQ